MTAEKRQWQTPQLTVLVRCRAEETVLAACKGSATAAGPNVRARRQCRRRNGTPCNAVAAS